MENKNHNHYYDLYCLNSGLHSYVVQQSGKYSEGDLDVFVIQTLKELGHEDIIGILNNYNNNIRHEDKDIKFYSGNGLGYYFIEKNGTYVAEWMSKEGVRNIINKLQEFGFEFMFDYPIDMNKIINKKDEKEVAGCNCRVCKEYNNWAIPDGVVGDGKYTCWNCASSYHRIIRGLDMDKIDIQVAMIRKNYKMGV